MLNKESEIIFFSEYFGIKSDDNNPHDFFDVILDADLPVFIDPFLIFCSEDEEYGKLYNIIINYLSYLTSKSIGEVNPNDFRQYFYFQEVQETHIGYSLQGNPGKGLGRWFGQILIRNLRSLFINPDSNSHLEKLCIVADKVGRDKISDFTINLIKNYLADYTSKIASNIKDQSKVREFTVRRAYFDEKREIWMDKKYKLPNCNGNYILLIPKDILTTGETWINKKDFYESVYELGIPNSISNDQIRFQFNKIMLEDINKKEKIKQIKLLVKSEPQIIESYIKYKEENSGDVSQESYKSLLNINQTINSEKIEKFTTLIKDFSPKEITTSLEEGITLIDFFKDTIENKGLWKEFWLKDGSRVEEKNVQNFFKLTWRGSKYNITAEGDNGTGPADFIISMGSEDVTVIEFKLASNSKSLPVKQVDSYKKANNTINGLIVVFCFNKKEVEKIQKGIIKKGLINSYFIDVSPQKSASKL